MTAAPAWPGVTEYLYQAASPALVVSEGTCIVPSEFSPRCSSFDCTPMAGMLTETGGERCSTGPLAALGPVAPAADAAGDGACCCESRATAIAPMPPTMRVTPATPASRARARRRGGGGGLNWLSSGQVMT